MYTVMIVQHFDCETPEEAAIKACEAADRQLSIENGQTHVKVIHPTVNDRLLSPLPTITEHIIGTYNDDGLIYYQVNSDHKPGPT